jgi:hypothetical protein
MKIKKFMQEETLNKLLSRHPVFILNNKSGIKFLADNRKH